MTAYVDSTDNAALGLPADVLTRAATKGISVARHLESASRKADTYLASRYDVPLTQWDDALEEVVCALAAWSVLCVLGFNPENPADNAVRVRREEAIEWLTSVREGRLSYGAGSAQTASSARVSTSARRDDSDDGTTSLRRCCDWDS